MSEPFSGNDCCFTRDGAWFRYRAAAVILKDGRVLMARNEADPYYYSVGGAVRAGETAEEAVVREVLEETGTRMEVDRLAFVHENFFEGSVGLTGLRCHEVALYFLMKVPEGFEPKGDSLSMHGAAEHMEWLPLDRFSSFRTYPEFFAAELPRLGPGIRHIVSRE